MKTQYEYVAEYEALPALKRKRLLVAARALGALCAQDAYLRGFEHPYEVTRDDIEALAEILEQYGVHGMPYAFTGNRHPIWRAFWRGVSEVPEPELEVKE